MTSLPDSHSKSKQNPSKPIKMESNTNAKTQHPSLPPTNNKYRRWTAKILHKKHSLELSSNQSNNFSKDSNNNNLQNNDIKKKNPILKIDPNIANSTRRKSSSNTPNSLLSYVSTPSSSIIDHCKCCGTILSYPSNVSRIKCLTCNTHFTLKVDPENSSASDSSESPSLPALSPILNHHNNENKENNEPDKTNTPLLSYMALKEAFQLDEAIIRSLNLSDKERRLNSNSIHKLYKNVDNLIENSFKNFEVLNSCFRLDHRKSINYSSPNLNFMDLKKFYSLLIKLPSKRPIYKLLTYSSNLLKHPPMVMDFNQINWLLIILENPLLYESLIRKKSLSDHFNDVSYDIIKRVIGLITSLDRSVLKYLIHWWSRLPSNELLNKVDFVNLYITFHINRLYTHLLYDKLGKNLPLTDTEDDINFKNKLELKILQNLNENNNDSLLRSLGIINTNSSSSSSSNNNVKISINLYSDCWHLRTACQFMSLLFYANKRKHHKLDDSCFYNSLIDYINVKQDYDIWEFNNSFIEHEKNHNKNPESLTTDYLLMEKNKTYLGITVLNGVYKRSNFTLCSYPFLISLGSKISILEHDAKKVMGAKAEQAFISSIIEGGTTKPNDIYFKISVRRNHITNDSLRQIQSHPNDVRKLLKVEFIDELGIDGGGLKKEWFLLLTKELFDANKGLISYKNENKMAYFAILNDGNYNEELFYLLGVVLGMAIYNSIILDIKFPKVIYNKLSGHHSTLEDLAELEPSLVKNLKKLNKMSHIEDLNLNFEITITDIYDNVKKYELIPNGANIPVNDLNKSDYISRYYKFLLDDIVDKQFKQFSNGFKKIMGTNVLSLFTPFEIQKLVIGDDNVNDINKFDIELLKNITKFQNCSNNDPIVIWFWNYFKNLSLRNQKKLMRFITGSDRIPATGLATIQFKVSKLIEDDMGYSEKLPISHTCFNEICLWEYKSSEILKQKLDMAINESEGFTLK